MNNCYDPELQPVGNIPSNPSKSPIGSSVLLQGAADQKIDITA